MRPGIRGTSAFMGARTRVTLAQAVQPLAKKKPNWLQRIASCLRSIGGRLLHVRWGD